MKKAGLIFLFVTLAVVACTPPPKPQPQTPQVK